MSFMLQRVSNSFLSMLSTKSFLVESDLQPPLYVPVNCRHSPSTWSYHPCWVNLHYWVSRLYKKLSGVLKSIPQCNISENTRSMLLYKTSTEYFSEFQAIIALWDVFNMPISLLRERNESYLCGICASLAVLTSCSRGICIYMYVLPKPEYMIWSTASAGTNDYCTSSKDWGWGGLGGQ